MLGGCGLAYSALVGLEREWESRVMRDQDIDTSCLHPSKQVLDQAPICWFLLCHNHFTVCGGVLRDARRERRGKTHPVLYREQYLRQQTHLAKSVVVSCPELVAGRWGVAMESLNVAN